MFTSAVVRLTVLSALFFSLSATAAVKMNMEPGLWEVSVQDPEMEKMMESMSPEVRKMMKKAMSVTHVCMTKAEIDRGFEEGSQLEGDCQITDVKQTGDKIISKAHCDSPDKVDIKTTTTQINSKAYQSLIETKTAGHTKVISSNGKWLKPDCGNVKPITR